MINISSYSEYIGHIGSVLIAISFMMSNIKTLRIINLIGAIVFTIYGVIIQSYPVIILDSFIIITDIYYLLKMTTQKDYFNINDTLSPNVFFVPKFLDYYKNDIITFFPEFDLSLIQAPKIILISRNLNPVGMFIYEENIKTSSIQIHLDYAIPKYRDSKNSFFVFNEKSKELTEAGFKTYEVNSTSKAHDKYLKKMGFRPIGKNNFQKEI